MQNPADNKTKQRAFEIPELEEAIKGEKTEQSAWLELLGDDMGGWLFGKYFPRHNEIVYKPILIHLN